MKMCITQVRNERKKRQVTDVQLQWLSNLSSPFRFVIFDFPGVCYRKSQAS